MRDRTVFTRRDGVPFAQCCRGCATAHRPVRRDRHVKRDRLLTKAARRGDRRFRPDPMHDGNGNRPTRSHAVKEGSSRDLYAISVGKCRERIQDYHLPTACVILEKVDAVEPFNTRCDLLR